MAVTIKKKSEQEDTWYLVHVMPVDGKIQTKFVNKARTKERTINWNEEVIERRIK